MGKKFYGLRGSQLNWTIGIIAGLDFLYDFRLDGLEKTQLTRA